MAAQLCSTRRGLLRHVPRRPRLPPAACRELHSAVRRAYLGPKLEDLSSGALPDAFEADERAAPDCPDLLQLVSGRQLLGAVRERRLVLLARQAAAAAALQEGRQAEAAGALLGEAAQAVAVAGQHQERHEQQQERQQLPEPSNSERAQSKQQPPQQQQREPDILDLFVGDELVASAVRHFPRQQEQPSGGSSSTSSTIGGGPAAGASSSSGGSSGTGASQPPEPGEGSSGSSLGGSLPAEVIGIYDRGGELLAQVWLPHGLEGEQAWPGGNRWRGLYVQPRPAAGCLLPLSALAPAFIAAAGGGAAA